MEARDYYFAVALLDHSYWILGSVAGSLAGAALGFDTTGVDFAMTALFLVIAVGPVSYTHLDVYKRQEYYDVYVTQPADAKWRLDNMHETYLEDMHSKYVYPNVFMSIEDTNKVTQYDTDIKKYAEQKKADWILNGGIEKEWDSYLKKMEQYGLSDYLAIKQKYFDKYQESLKSEQAVSYTHLDVYKRQRKSMAQYNQTFNFISH